VSKKVGLGNLGREVILDTLPIEIKVERTVSDIKIGEDKRKKVIEIHPTTYRSYFSFPFLQFYLTVK
jgi:hypothetical protein